MDQERTTPEVELEPGDSDTPPPEEPAAPPPAEERPDQPAPAVIAQAEYTRATQLASAVRRELGLPKSATQAEVIGALAAARQVPDPSADLDEGQEDDPRVIEALTRARESDLRWQRAIYGEEFTTDAVELLNAARQTDDIEDLFTLVAAFRDKHGQAPAVVATEDPGPSAKPDESGDGVIDTSEGERTPRPVQQPSGGRRESGVVGALRGLFEAAGSERGR